MKKARTNPFSISARQEEQVEAPHDLAEALKALDERFQNKFGREPGPGDPLFFDPAADQPKPPTAVQQKAIIDAMHQIMLSTGIDPAFAYAFQKTGLLLTEDHIHLFTVAELAEWDGAVAEFKSAKMAEK